VIRLSTYCNPHLPAVPITGYSTLTSSLARCHPLLVASRALTHCALLPLSILSNVHLLRPLHVTEAFFLMKNRQLDTNSITSFNSSICPWSRLSTISPFTCSGNPFSCMPSCLTGRCNVLSTCSLCGPTDNAADCSSLLAVYSAWGNQPASWAASITAHASICSWSGISCSNNRVSSMQVFHFIILFQNPRIFCN